jgi:hypothetical protein
MNSYLQWFKRALLLGMILNGGAIIGIFFFPHAFLRLLSIPEPPLIWVRAVGMLVANISVSYIPALLNPAENRWVAIYTVVPRLTSALFFCTQVWFFDWDSGFLNLGLFDFVFGAVQSGLLYGAFSRGRAGERARTLTKA